MTTDVQRPIISVPVKTLMVGDEVYVSKTKKDNKPAASGLVVGRDATGVWVWWDDEDVPMRIENRSTHQHRLTKLFTVAEWIESTRRMLPHLTDEGAERLMHGTHAMRPRPTRRMP